MSDCGPLQKPLAVESREAADSEFLIDEIAECIGYVRTRWITLVEPAECVSVGVFFPTHLFKIFNELTALRVYIQAAFTGLRADERIRRVHAIAHGRMRRRLMITRMDVGATRKEFRDDIPVAFPGSSRVTRVSGRDR